MKMKIDRSQRVATEADSRYEVNELGYLVLQRRNPGIPHDTVEKIEDEADEEELNRSLKIAGKRQSPA